MLLSTGLAQTCTVAVDSFFYSALIVGIAVVNMLTVTVNVEDLTELCPVNCSLGSDFGDSLCLGFL